MIIKSASRITCITLDISVWGLRAIFVLEWTGRTEARLSVPQIIWGLTSFSWSFLISSIIEWLIGWLREEMKNLFYVHTG